MKQKKLLFMISLLAVAFGFTALIAVLAGKREKAEGLLCVTSFFPVQLLAESVAEGAEGVTVKNLTENYGGCIHDYTLTTQDMRLLSDAELFLMNGGGMELFLEKTAEEYKDLMLVDTSEGYDFLEGVAHNHTHGDGAGDAGNVDEAEHEDEADKADKAEHADEAEHGLNAHLWLDIDGYLLQLSRVEEAFVTVDPAQETLYRKNAEACRRELSELQAAYGEAKTALDGREAVVFHEGFVYLLNMLGIETVHCLAMDVDTQISAGEAAEILEECRLHGITRLFAEEDYAQTVEDTFAKELGGEVIVLDPVTGGTASGPTAGERKGVPLYCWRMRENLRLIWQAYGLR